ncbi:sporulation protein, YlmC/YmxH family [Clostridium sp. USBA 49]|uniref:YlmC/YmxH family sporulation protein n=1 Tax=Clostridium TaxID=1485 RepID=UPI00099A8A79|nr:MULTISPECIES: YlmC/YmxH family sporulation protein [Clostridium]SKA76059.1 sporulation protein, YlmC/YmxH family [Clostridium sp. USBA 49]
MEESMYAINSLKSMEVIDVNSGTKLGYIKDFKIDCDGYKIISILLPNQNVSWFNRNNIIEIPWSKVVKIGVDVILVEGEEIIENNKE